MFRMSHKPEPCRTSGTSPTTSRFRSSGKFTVAEFAEMLGFPVEALNVIIVKNRTAYRRPFYNISQLAERWNVSRAQVYNILREADFKVLNIASKTSEERQGWRIPASVVEKIEQSRMEHLPEVAA
jgi:hypothetical protein